MILPNRSKLKFLLSDNLSLLVMALPCILLVIAFSYVPLFGWLYGFFDYKPGYNLFECKFVGLKFFNLAFNDNEILTVMRNTLVLGFLGLAASVLPPAFAILLSELKGNRFKKIFQIVTTIPNFISWILVYAIFFLLLSVNDGIVNKVLLSAGLIKTPLNLLADENAVWPLQTFIGIWKNIGFQAIIYLAGISGIAPELYDAADVDGAGRFRKIIHVTIPGLMQTYFSMLLLGIGLILSNGFDQFYLFKNALTYNKIEVLDVYLYDTGLGNNQYSLSTVLGMSKTIISVILLYTANGLSRWTRGTSII